MAISDQLTLLNNTKTAIRTAINNKGGSVGASDTFASYATAIDNLPIGGDDSALRDLIEGDITTLNIPSGTTIIRDYAFYYQGTLVSVTIPSTVTSIGTSSFQNCTHLQNITIPNSVTSIGISGFSGAGIVSFVFPNTVTVINNRVLESCQSLTSVTIPATVTRIGTRSFAYCTRLQNITIPNSVTSIDGTAMAGCTHLNYVIVEATTPPTLGAAVLDNTNNCPIYVPAASVDAYKAASGWSAYASRIYPIQQVATVDGNPVYNYDLGMTSTDTITSENMAKMPAGTSVEFAEGLTNIATGEINYQEVILPSTFTGFGDSDMIGSSVTTITSNAVTPPSAFRNQLGGSGLTAIYVPASSVDTYKAHAAWSGFASIIQAIPVQAKLTITLQDDSIYVEPSDGATTLNNEVLINLADAGEIDTSVKKIEVGEMITELEDMYYDDNPDTLCGTFYMMSMSELVLPAGLTAMGENTFANGGVSSSITCYAVTPPTFTGELPGTPRRHPTVYVPAESVEAYQTAWSNYASWIQAIPTE